MEARKYWNPYIGGVALGLVLLAAFVVSSGGLGATALPKRAIAMGAAALAPEWTRTNPVLGGYVTSGEHPLRDWLVVETVGMLLGGFIAAVSAGRFHARIERGPRITARRRLAFAAGGGVLMGFAAGLARGCTSGQALSGGALLATGSWAFMLMVFAGGYAFAALVRRQWT